jgi:hypothetical protein
MSLYIDLNGMFSTAFWNLYTISGENVGLGETRDPTDGTVYQITYNEGPGQPATADRLNTLVNTVFLAGNSTSDVPIVITAMNGGNDPYGNGAVITGNGATYVDSTGASPVIRVVYDVSQNCGTGIACFDTSGNPITAPNPVILYHELSHAYHYAINQVPFPQTACPGNTSDEPAAETDENVLRSQLGLCLRNVCNHGISYGPGNDCGGSSGIALGGPPVVPSTFPVLGGGPYPACALGNSAGVAGVNCFIVSATTGSSEAAEVKRLRQLGDRIAAESRLGAQLFHLTYREYYQFSPEIAAGLEQDVIARTAVLWIVVRPLLAWYALARTLALAHADQNAVSQATQEVLSACPRDLSGALIATLLEAIQAGKPLPADVPQRLLAFAHRFQEAARFRFASWAMLDPLVRVWTSTTRHVDLVDEVSQWLANAPVEALAPPSDTKLLDVELTMLAGAFDFKPAARKQIGERLAIAWPEAANALERHGFA